MVELRTHYLGLDLPSPLVASASPLTGTLDGLRRLEAAGVAAHQRPPQCLIDSCQPIRLVICGGRDRRRSGDLPLFRRTLCQLSYPTEMVVAVPTGFEPATSGLTGRRALQTAPRDRVKSELYCAPPTGFEPVLPP